MNIEHEVRADAAQEAIDHYNREARARLRAYKRVSCSAERWDRMCALLDLARDTLRHTECRDGDATRCPACALEAEIDKMLAEAR